MKDIKKEKQEKTNWLGRLETAGELPSGGLFLKIYWVDLLLLLLGLHLMLVLLWGCLLMV